MGFSIHYLKDHRFMYTKISGEINNQNLKQHVIDFNKETEGISDLRELADCRDLINLKALTVNGTSYCATLENNKPQSLLAILVTESPLLFGMARVYQIFAEGRRGCVKIFKDINNALEWLAKDEQEITLFNEFIKECITSTTFRRIC